MNIAFNTLSARAGAGISVFQSLMPSIAAIDKTNKYFIFAAKEQKEIIDYIPERFQAIILSNVPQNPFFRVAWEQFFLPFYLKKYKIDLLYSVGNTTILFAPCKILLFIENPNPFTKIIKQWTFRDKIRNRLLFFLGWLSAIRADRIRFCSYRSMEIITKIYRINKNKCFVLYHGLMDNWFDSSSTMSPVEYNYILSVSVVAPHKNYEVLIKAFNIIKSKKLYDGKLLIIGDIDCYKQYYTELLQLVVKYNLTNEVVFLGKIPNKRLKDYYRNSDLFIFQSLAESFGIPLIEALSSGIPVVSSDGDKYKELFIPFNELGGDKVIYFDPYSPEDLANKITYTLKNKDKLLQKLSNEREELKRRFSINTVAKVLTDEFNRIYYGGPAK